MSAIYKYPFVRYVKRGQSGIMSCTAMTAMTADAYAALVDAPWEKVTDVSSDLPPHKWSQSGFKDTYDAAKFCGDYNNGVQRAYACAVCYTINLPIDASKAENPAVIQSISAHLCGDRWLADGAVLSVILSDSEEPPAWAEVLSATHTSPDPVTEETSEDATWFPPLRKITRANDGADSECIATIPVEESAKSYAHVILRIGDYKTYHSAWIEGGALLLGNTLELVSSREIAADQAPEPETPVEVITEDSLIKMPWYQVKPFYSPDGASQYIWSDSAYSSIPMLYTGLNALYEVKFQDSAGKVPACIASSWAKLCTGALEYQYSPTSLGGAVNFLFKFERHNGYMTPDTSPAFLKFNQKIIYPSAGSSASTVSFGYPSVYKKNVVIKSMVILYTFRVSRESVDGIVISSSTSEQLLPAFEDFIYKFYVYSCNATQNSGKYSNRFYINSGVLNPTEESAGLNLSQDWNFRKLINGVATFEGEYTAGVDSENLSLNIPTDGTNHLTLVASGSVKEIKTNTLLPFEKPFVMEDETGWKTYLIVFTPRHYADLEVDEKTGYPKQLEYGGEFSLAHDTGRVLAFHKMRDK